MELADGLRAVALEPGDAAAVAELIRASELRDGGIAERTVQDMRTIWSRPSFSLADEAIGVRDGDELVGYGSIPWPGDADVCVAPAHCGRGIGAALLGWSEAAARAAGWPSVGQSKHERAAAALALLRGAGYEHTRTSWILEIALDAAPAAPAPPAGYALRTFVPGADERPAYEVIRAAFAEWEEHVDGFEDWRAETVEREGFVAEQLVLAVWGDAVVGALVLADDDEAFVHQLAVARPHRGRGLAKALLQHAFGIAWARGGRTCVLATDTRTGALGLYEHVGMRPRGTYLHLERALA